MIHATATTCNDSPATMAARGRQSAPGARPLVAGFLAFSGLLATGLAQASITSVVTRPLLAGTDLVSWGVPADDFTVVGNSFARTSTGGITATATAAQPMAVFMQNGIAYTANFNSGEMVLSTFFGSGPIRIDFGTAIRGVGFEIAHDVISTFTGTMNYFGAGNVLLGTTAVTGASSFANDGSAPFLGGMSSALDILAIEISVDLQGGFADFAINQMSLNLAPVTSVPEPGSALLVAFGLSGLLLRKGRSRSA